MKLYNLFTKKKEDFKTWHKNKVLMYVCGVTPYDTTHLGHAFTFIFFDTLFRYLTFKGFKVKYLQNVTDVDDDLLKRAKRDGVDWQKLGNYWTKRYLRDMKILHAKPPTYYKKATSAMDKIIEMITVLINKNFAYIKDGQVYFNVSRTPTLGQLSGYSLSQMLWLIKDRGGEINDPNKKNPLDFLLWYKNNPGDPSWPSPWGKGQPGWHIECPALIMKHLGSQIDIHGGGRDLDFPHHEYEIVEAESYSGKCPFVRFWLHTGAAMKDGEKMSKSLGNLVLVADLLKKYSPRTIRAYLLSHFYRHPWEYDEEELKAEAKFFDGNHKIIEEAKAIQAEKPAKSADLDKFLSFIEDDMNIPQAISEMKTLIKKLKYKKDFNLLKILKIELDILGL